MNRAEVWEAETRSRDASSSEKNNKTESNQLVIGNKGDPMCDIPTLYVCWFFCRYIIFGEVYLAYVNSILTKVFFSSFEQWNGKSFGEEPFRWNVNPLLNKLSSEDWVNLKIAKGTWCFKVNRPDKNHAKQCLSSVVRTELIPLSTKPMPAGQSKNLFQRTMLGNLRISMWIDFHQKISWSSSLKTLDLPDLFFSISYISGLFSYKATREE